MSHVLPIASALALLACAPAVYVQPSVGEPHAMVSVRVLHHEASGPQMRFGVRANGFQLPVGRLSSATVGAPVTRTFRVRPERTRFLFASHFSHSESRMETVMETERYACGTQTTGYGSTSRTSTRYCSRTVPRQRWRNVTITDGVCDASLGLTPRAGTRYLVQYDYHATGMCRARCFVRSPGVGGEFQLTACGAPAPPPPTSVAPPPAPTSVTPGPAPTAGGEAPVDVSPAAALTEP